MQIIKLIILISHQTFLYNTKRVWLLSPAWEQETSYNPTRTHWLAQCYMISLCLLFCNKRSGPLKGSTIMIRRITSGSRFVGLVQQENVWDLSPKIANDCTRSTWEDEPSWVKASHKGHVCLITARQERTLSSAKLYMYPAFFWWWLLPVDQPVGDNCFYVSGLLVMTDSRLPACCWWLLTEDRPVSDDCFQVIGLFVVTAFRWQARCWWLFPDDGPVVDDCFQVTDLFPMLTSSYSACWW